MLQPIFSSVMVVSGQSARAFAPTKFSEASNDSIVVDEHKCTMESQVV